MVTINFDRWRAGMFDNLRVTINKIKNISHAEIELPVQNGIYCMVGANGCGKSTIMACLAQTVYRSSLYSLCGNNVPNNAFVSFSYQNAETMWTYVNGRWRANTDDDKIHFNGMYEGSLFYGTRFRDSVKVDQLVNDGIISQHNIVDADEYIIQKLSFILQGNTKHYKSLKRVKNKTIAENAGLRSMPYFQVFNGKLVSQYRMSSGECMMISLLHFIYNSIIRRSLPTNQPVLLIIDEIELALHPVAIARLLNLLEKITNEYSHVAVYLSSHSPEVIKGINPSKLYMIENDIENDEGGELSIHSPCYPSYAIRSVYMQDGYDYVILVEDMLAKYCVESVLVDKGLKTGKLINVVPIGGWDNVLKFHEIATKSNMFGIGTKIISVLDGDVKEKARKSHIELKKLFLPITSVEKYLYKVCNDRNFKDMKNTINDNYFDVDSMDNIKETVPDNADGKSLYNALITNLKKRSISEDSFVRELCRIIKQKVNFTDFENTIEQMLTKSEAGLA